MKRDLAYWNKLRRPDPSACLKFQDLAHALAALVLIDLSFTSLLEGSHIA